MRSILVTGGAGFIGSAVLRCLLAEREARLVNFDKLTYAGNPDSIPGAELSERYTFLHADICDADAVRLAFQEHQPDTVIHLAAETHVDRSIDGPRAFIGTNVVGTLTLLEAAWIYWNALPNKARAGFRFVHVSTDEVFGSLGAQGAFHEESPYRPNSPYAASKAASDHLVRAWHHTYGLPVIITNTCNNYGPFQFPEKLIPLMILRAQEGRDLPVYGAGQNVRDWLYVEDHARALVLVAEQGRVGETYCIGGASERRTIDVVCAICALLDELAPNPAIGEHESLIRFVADRPGHDQRYAIDASKIQNQLDWSPAESFESGLRKTVVWYLANTEWRERVLSGAYRGERLGLLAPS